MIDSHCHLDAEIFDSDRDAVLRRAAARGVDDVVVPAVDEASWSRLLALALARTARPRCHPALGIHPVALPAIAPEDDEAVLARLAARLGDPGVVAVGECGLDTSIDLEDAPLERQERVLRAQLALAAERDLPVVLHARGPHAYERLLGLLREAELPRAGGVLHSYGGGVDFLRGFLELPLSFGFAGPSTFPNARKVRASIQAVPADRLLAETDAPDQTPEPHRPGRNEPAYVAEVIGGLARARGEPPTEVAARTAENARRLFRLGSPA